MNEVIEINSLLRDSQRMREEAISLTKKALRRALLDVFEADDDVKVVVFGVSSAEQRDEQFPQGVYGPMISTDDDFEFNHDDVYDLFDHGSRAMTQSDALSLLFRELDWDTVAPALGMSMPDGYESGSEQAFIVRRNAEGKLKIEQEYVGC